jgi:hypothetical protein
MRANGLINIHRDNPSFIGMKSGSISKLSIGIGFSNPRFSHSFQLSRIRLTEMHRLTKMGGSLGQLV